MKKQITSIMLSMLAFLIPPSDLRGVEQDTNTNNGWGLIFWGSTNKDVCAGLQVQSARPYSLESGHARVSIYLRSHDQRIRMFVEPSRLMQFQFVLTDQNGDLVPRTPTGLKLGGSLPPSQSVHPRNSKSITRRYLRTSDVTFYRTVDLLEFFDIREGGTYQLKLKVLLQTLSHDWHLKPFELETGSVPIEIQKGKEEPLQSDPNGR